MRAPRRGRAAGRAGRVVAAVLGAVLCLVGLPAAAAAQAAPPSLSVASNCLVQGSGEVRIVVLGTRWSTTGPVALRYQGAGTRQLGTALPRDSQRRQVPGAFSFVTTVPASASMSISGTQGRSTTTVSVPASSTCPASTAVTPTCLSGPGRVTFTGAGWPAGAEVNVDVDPFGPADGGSTAVTTTRAGSFSTILSLTPAGGPIPIVATHVGQATTGAPVVIIRVSFVDPCPPPSTTTTSTTRPSTVTTPTTAPGSTTTASTGPTTTRTVVIGSTTTQPPTTAPPVTLPPGPGTTAAFIRVSPRTVRPGRCAVVQVRSAPPGAPVVARFADGPPVTRPVLPDGTAVLSVCVPHDSGVRWGPVALVVSIGASPPAELVTLLRVPARPQPPLR